MDSSNKFSEVRIVIVDDSDFSRGMIKKMLQDSGFEVAGEANSAEQAMQVIRDKKAQILITDIVMPEISGIELTEKVNKTFDDIAVIIISSLSQEHVILEAIGAGASDFISKPIQKEQLIESVQKIATRIIKEAG